MSISIEKDKCIGCGLCTEACPGNLLILKNNRATIRDVRDCWGCTACVKACPRDAIFYYLSANLGGAGGRLYAHDSRERLVWGLQIDGKQQQITVNKNQANAY